MRNELDNPIGYCCNATAIHRLHTSTLSFPSSSPLTHEPTPDNQIKAQSIALCCLISPCTHYYLSKLFLFSPCTLR
eukprot:NODE_2372_length_363_cov_47.245763_g2362_i0.p1 GENE.NODE_2372_length_363_cov_47.245763_g2362_i0~~NODE_2372_length_363_cov_47.245763_g2362_i0.p1  ORF type:complete len:76 (+),score=7.97 NODE_2372_length_363_cov_47.245763_g2362_i0:92-319(+)